MAAKKETFTNMTMEELKAKLTEIESDYAKKRFDKVTGALTQTHKLSEAKKNVARIKTKMRELELKEAKANK